MKKHKIIYHILLQLLICFNIYGQELIKDTYVDLRDNQKYNIVKYDNTMLFAENLRYKTKASLSFKNDSLNDIKYGRYYTYYEATKVCPSGWGLINTGDKLTNSIIIKYWNSIKTDTSIYTGRITNGVSFMKGSAHWWVQSDNLKSQNDERLSLYFLFHMMEMAEFPKDRGFSVRCVKHN